VAGCGAEINADGHRPGAARAVSSPEDFASCNCITGFPHERGTGHDVIALHIPIGDRDDPCRRARRNTGLQLRSASVSLRRRMTSH
jgi:hypothetical protein